MIMNSPTLASTLAKNTPRMTGGARGSSAACAHRATQALEDVLDPAIEGAMRWPVVSSSGPWRRASASGSRNEAGDQDRNDDGDGEFVQQPADDAAHEHDRDEHRRQRQGHGQDGEADLGRALERGLLAALRHPRYGGRCSPASRWRHRPQSRPTGSAPSATDCRDCIPAAAMPAKVPITAMGRASEGMMVAERRRRNRKITATTITPAISSVICTSCDRGADGLAAIVENGQVEIRAGCASNRGRTWLICRRSRWCWSPAAAGPLPSRRVRR